MKHVMLWWMHPFRILMAIDMDPSKTCVDSRDVYHSKLAVTWRMHDVCI